MVSWLAVIVVTFMFGLLAWLILDWIDQLLERRYLQQRSTSAWKGGKPTSIRELIEQERK